MTIKLEAGKYYRTRAEADRLTPAQLRDLACVISPPSGRTLYGREAEAAIFAQTLNEEAARREAAEARRAQRLNDPMPALEDLVKRQGPDSAAADMLYVLFTGFARGHVPGDIVPVGFKLADVLEVAAWAARHGAHEDFIKPFIHLLAKETRDA